MNEKNIHGRVFKKLREERGYKLKDVAGDIISTRTLTRFENDETSLPIATFEELLENYGVSYLDYLVCYYKHTEMPPSISLKSNQPYMQLDSISKLMNEYKKEIKNNDINFEKRLEVLTYINSIVSREDLELFEENKRMIKKKIELTNKLGLNEIQGLINLIRLSSKEDYSVEYIDKIIEECLQGILYGGSSLKKCLAAEYCELLHVAVEFLSMNGYYDLAEKRCKDTIRLYTENPFLLNKVSNTRDIYGILAKIYLRQNKIEGVELANTLLKFDSIVVEITEDSFYKYIMENSYKTFCEVNKTGIDIEF